VTDYPDDQACRVSHEAIYQWVYAQPVSTLARELIGLRTGRTATSLPNGPPRSLTTYALCFPSPSAITRRHSGVLFS